MTERERSVVIGSVLGDAFLQQTGKRNARLRFEHSVKQHAYLSWKWQELRRYMQDRPKRVDRFNPIWKKTYTTVRCQSHASPEFGKMRILFYAEHQKRIPDTIRKLLNPLAFAVWFMDDGYYYSRDRTAYIYLSKLSAVDVRRLTNALAARYDLYPRVERKKTDALDLKFSAAETKQLITIIAPHVISSMRYKIGEEPRID